MSYNQLKAEQGLCAGTRAGFSLKCNGTIYTCTKCGNEGCRQTRENTCSGQGFDVKGRCLKCNEYAMSGPGW